MKKKGIIIGFGGMGIRHQKALASLGIQVIAICDKNIDKLNNLKLSNVKKVSNYKNLLNLDADIVCISSNTKSRENIIKDLCLSSKKSIHSFADIGSGAGFPGAVISIMAEAENIPIDTILVDSNKKKCSFLSIIKKELQLPYNVLNKRSEDIREKFDIIASRAVTSLGNFLKSNYNIIAKDSNLIVLKGKKWMQEVKESKKKWKFKLNVVKNNIQLDSSGGVTLIIRNLEK